MQHSRTALAIAAAGALLSGVALAGAIDVAAGGQETPAGEHPFVDRTPGWQHPMDRCAVRRGFNSQGHPLARTNILCYGPGGVGGYYDWLNNHYEPQGGDRVAPRFSNPRPTNHQDRNPHRPPNPWAPIPGTTPTPAPVPTIVDWYHPPTPPAGR